MVLWHYTSDWVDAGTANTGVIQGNVRLLKPMHLCLLSGKEELRAAAQRGTLRADLHPNLGFLLKAVTKG